MGSSRLPGKVLADVGGRPMLWHIIDRLRRAPGVSRVVVATSDAATDEPIRAFCSAEGLEVFAGNEQDVLERYHGAATQFAADPVLRITADCPFVDPGLVGRVLALYQRGHVDYAAAATGSVAHYTAGNKFPDGLDVECFSYAALSRARREATVKSDREHVTPYLYRIEGLFSRELVFCHEDLGTLRWTVDHPQDLELVRQVYDALYRPERPFDLRDILAHVAAHPELQRLNQAFVGHEGYAKVWNPDG